MISHDAVVDAIRRVTTRASTPSSDHDLNPGMVPPPGRALRPASVLVGIEAADGGPRVILTKRASHLLHHPGQIAFPGGKAEKSDAGVEATALREAGEEIGLPRDQVELIGVLPTHETVTGFMVTPVLGLIRPGFAPVLQRSEVDEVFAVPLAHVMDPSRYRVERRIWRGEWRSYYAVPWGPYYIWGATARILRTLAERMSA